MNQFGINKAVICPMGRGLIDTPRGNDEIAAVLRRYPDRFVGFAGANPWYEEEALKELDRAVGKLGFKGLKLHPALQGILACDDLVYPLVERAIKLRIPVYIHSGTPPYSLPFQIGELANTFPEATIIMGHFGYDAFWTDVLPVAKKNDNLFLETSRHPVNQHVERCVEELGAERILFGTDLPYTNPYREVEKIRLLKINEEARRKILGENMAEILGLKE